MPELTMNSRGFYEGELLCKKCSKPLSGEHGDRPAETYAGTYTGLCYNCQSSGSYVVSTDPLDGAQTVSHPPHCPSWRRDRETYIAYADCPDCHGAGKKTIQREYARGGPYPVFCETCLKRFSSHPRRQADQAAEKARVELINESHQSALKEFRTVRA